MKKEHKYNSLLKQFNVHELVDFVTELQDAMYNSANVLVLIKKLDSAESDEFTFMEELELLSIPNFKLTYVYAACSCSEYPPISRCLRKIVGYANDGLVQKYNQIISDIVDAWAGMTQAEHDALEKVTRELVSLYSFVLRYEFDLDAALESYNNCNKNENQMDIDYPFEQYCKKFNLPLIDSIEKIILISQHYKPVLPVFDDYPELEEPFEQIMGPYITDIDPEQLSLDIVKNVINGSIKPVDVYALMYGEED